MTKHGPNLKTKRQKFGFGQLRNVVSPLNPSQIDRTLLESLSEPPKLFALEYQATLWAMKKGAATFWLRASNPASTRLVRTPGIQTWVFTKLVG